MKKYIDIKKASTIIDKFCTANILVVGDLMVDNYIYGTTSRVSPEAPVPIVDVQKTEMFLGGSGNVINNISALGGNVYACGVVGDDETSHVILDKLARKNIEIDGIIIDKFRKTTLKNRIMSQEQQVARFDIETKKDLNINITKKILNYIKSKKEKIDVIIISDYGKGTITKYLIREILKIKNRTNIKICCDPKRLDLSFYNGIDILTPNHFEAERSAISMGLIKTNILEVGKLLLRKLDLKALLITRGEKGSSLFTRENYKTIHTYFSPPKVINVCDVSGAGDTVIATFSLSIASGANLIKASKISNIAAGIVVSKLGTATTTKDELKDFLKTHYK